MTIYHPSSAALRERRLLAAVHPLDRSFSFTARAWREIDDTVRTEDFAHMEDREIFSALSHRLSDIPFRDYLKRFLYEKTEMLLPFRSVPEEEYLDIILQAFHDTETPCSFSPSTTRLRQAVHNWLTQDEVSRETVLLLGFGLYMTPDDVNRFLTRAQHAAALDPDDPLEGLCLYCYEHEYRFSGFRRLRRRLQALTDKKGSAAANGETLSAGEEALVRRLAGQAGQPGMTPARQRVMDTFLRLYRQTQQCLSSARLPSATPSDLEKVFSASVPLGKSGNLVRFSCPQGLTFARRRVTRQRLNRLLSGSQQPDRYDLLTLQFYLFTETRPGACGSRESLTRFIAQADEMLAFCGFCGINPTDSLDAFLLMCLLTAEPMGVYSDVMERAYSSQTGGAL